MSYLSDSRKILLAEKAMGIKNPQTNAVLTSLEAFNHTGTVAEISIHSGLPIDVTASVLNEIGSIVKAQIHVVKHSEKQCNFRDEKAIQGDFSFGTAFLKKQKQKNEHKE